ncbi:hypothetical protein [Paenibacillus sp. PK3_47]|uniref:hypothetical protein n=1 Tax=Paenibacillus sp. PK3_47 TaxID=2072642 RepID=UPI00201DC52B|nr:hypothetical protein [Paenibacillus sp. PK3_47]
MSRTFLLRIWLGFIIIATAGGCSAFNSETADEHAAAAAGPAFSLVIGDNDLTGSAGRQLSEAYIQGITLGELLESSGVAEFSEDGERMVTVNGVSLSPEMVWEIQAGGKTVTNWNSVIMRDQTIVISAKRTEGKDPLQPVILKVSGGSGQPELTHAYVYSFADELTVRSLLKSSGIVGLSENNKRILTVNDYSPLTSEEWKLKVNDKGLLSTGIDMKLRPQDTLELSLVLR